MRLTLEAVVEVFLGGEVVMMVGRLMPARVAMALNVADSYPRALITARAARRMAARVSAESEPTGRPRPRALGAGPHPSAMSKR